MGLLHQGHDIYGRRGKFGLPSSLISSTLFNNFNLWVSSSVVVENEFNDIIRRLKRRTKVGTGGFWIRIVRRTLKENIICNLIRRGDKFLDKFHEVTDSMYLF